MARFAETLLALIADDQEEAVRLATERLNALPRRSSRRPTCGSCARSSGSCATTPQSTIERLADDLLGRLAENHVDYTLFFRRLCASAADPSADADVAALFDEPGAFRTWAETWRQRLATEAVSPEARAAAMKHANPAFIPRNHRVEEVIEAAVRLGDFGPFELLADVLCPTLRRSAGARRARRCPRPRPGRLPDLLRDMNESPELLLRMTLIRLTTGLQRRRFEPS